MLLGFVMITIGFAAGRRTAPMHEGNANDHPAAAAAESSQVLLYAAHTTFRCPECTKIEWLARELVEGEFAEELENGVLEFRTIDYTRDIAFARRYNIASSTIVIVRFTDGKEKDFQRLDEVWAKINDRDAFIAYVRAALLDSLAAETGS